MKITGKNSIAQHGIEDFAVLPQSAKEITEESLNGQNVKAVFGSVEVRPESPRTVVSNKPTFKM